MKELQLLYENEEASTLLIYRYKVHAWEWDCKFWLVGDKWCAKLDGTQPVGDLDKYQERLINQFAARIEQRERENKNWIAYNKCRKRTCICKKNCIQFCSCGECKGKITDCDRRSKLGK